MATFRFKTLDPTRKPLLVDEAEDKIPRIKEPTTPTLSPTLQRLLMAAAEAEQAMRTRTLIYKTDIAKALIAAAGDQVSKSTKQWRESCEGTFFTVQQDGDQVLAVSCKTGQTRDYGGFRTDIYRSLEKRINSQKTWQPNTYEIVLHSSIRRNMTWYWKLERD